MPLIKFDVGDVCKWVLLSLALYCAVTVYVEKTQETPVIGHKMAHMPNGGFYVNRAEFVAVRPADSYDAARFDLLSSDLLREFVTAQQGNGPFGFADVIASGSISDYYIFVSGFLGVCFYVVCFLALILGYKFALLWCNTIR
uniref:Triple gene block protein 3 n=1 Tax=Fern benyvirus TaxID=2933169 RepID=A0A9C7LLP1_9VIRU|nr:triple gene block protein 3 [Fern benyvirus]CAI5383957.1 triple gene block protein 3 [Fern benyvirus]